MFKVGDKVKPNKKAERDLKYLSSFESFLTGGKGTVKEITANLVILFLDNKTYLNIHPVYLEKVKQKNLPDWW